MRQASNRCLHRLRRFSFAFGLRLGVGRDLYGTLYLGMASAMLRKARQAAESAPRRKERRQVPLLKVLSTEQAFMSLFLKMPRKDVYHGEQKKIPLPKLGYFEPWNDSIDSPLDFVFLASQMQPFSKQGNLFLAVSSCFPSAVSRASWSESCLSIFCLPGRTSFSSSATWRSPPLEGVLNHPPVTLFTPAPLKSRLPCHYSSHLSHFVDISNGSRHRHAVLPSVGKSAR